MIRPACSRRAGCYSRFLRRLSRYACYLVSYLAFTDGYGRGERRRKAGRGTVVSRGRALGLAQTYRTAPRPASGGGSCLIPVNASLLPCFAGRPGRSGSLILLLLVFVNLLSNDGDLPDFLLGISPRESPIVGELIIAIGLIVAWKWEGLGGILLLRWKLLSPSPL